MTVLGGFSNFFGPVTGALALTLLQDQLQSATQYWRFVLGAILAAMVIFFPRGLAGIAGDLAASFWRRRATSPAGAASGESYVGPRLRGGDAA
jgi:branched-chain amino acid transport system permease protein